MVLIKYSYLLILIINVKIQIMDLLIHQCIIFLHIWLLFIKEFVNIFHYF